MRKVYFFAAALVATLTGCDNSEMNNITDSKQVAVEVTAGIEGVTTRMKKYDMPVWRRDRRFWNER